MALSDKWTRAQLRTLVRNELLDPSGKWWTDNELNLYLEAWQNRIQDELEFIWQVAVVPVSAGTATFTASDVINASGNTLTWDTASNSWQIEASTWDIASVSLPRILRYDGFYWNGDKLSARTTPQMDQLDLYWRKATPSTPIVVYPIDDTVAAIWPHPDADGILLVEYPVQLTFEDDSATMQIPAWTRYSAKDYCAYRAYLRLGSNQDLDKAQRRKAKFEKQLNRYRTVKATYFPEHFPSLRPGGAYEARINDPLAQRRIG